MNWQAEVTGRVREPHPLEMLSVPPSVERHGEVPMFSLFPGRLQEARLKKSPDFEDGQLWMVPAQLGHPQASRHG